MEYACRAGTSTAIHGETQFPVRMRIIIGMAELMTETILNKPAASGNIRQIRGAFLICTAMSGSGRGRTKQLTPPATGG